MVRVMKSPNMISTTGRRPVIAAPTATPVNPASEIGVSTTRLAPNSSTNPERTLKGVPASATSSPMMHTRESRRISSASASRTACANVSSRSGIDVLLHLVDVRIGRGNGELHRRLHDGENFGCNLFQGCSVSIALLKQPLRQYENGIAIRFPKMFFLFGAIVFAIDIADMMAAVAVGIALQEGGADAAASAIHKTLRNFMNRAHVLSVHSRGFDTECRSPAENSARRGLLIVRVLVVLIVFADVNHGQLPQLRQVHYFVERSLPESPFSEEADCHPVRTESFCGESGAGGDADAATNNCVCAKITGCGIGDVHRSAFAAAVACFFSKQFGEHAVRRCAFGEAVSVAAM